MFREKSEHKDVACVATCYDSLYFMLSCFKMILKGGRTVL